MLASKSMLYKFISYSFVGVISVGVYFLSVFLLVELLHKDPVFSSAIAFIIMTFVSFYLNKRYTFGVQFTYTRFLRFTIISVIGFILNYMIMYGVVHLLDYHYLIGEIVTIIVIPMMNFTLNALWAFKD